MSSGTPPTDAQVTAAERGGGPRPGAPSERATWDVVVVGAGPAGAATALHAARAGLATLLVERSDWPRHKVCGCCVHPAGVRELERLDPSLTPRALGARPLGAARVRARGRTARLAISGAVAVSRARLDARLVETARAAGVEFRPGTRAVLLAPERDAALRHLELSSEGDLRAVRARVVVAADGLGAPLLARGGEVASPASGGARVGLGARLPADAADVAEDEVELVVGRSGYVGLVRLEDGSVDLAAAFDPRALAERGPAAAVAAVLAEGGRAPLVGLEGASWRGTPSLSRRTPRPAARRALAVGDAAGYVEPFTGEGIAWALVGARLLGAALPELVADWSEAGVRAWSRAQARELARRRRRCALVARGVRSPRLVAALAPLVRRSEFVAALLVRVGYGPARP